MSVNPDQESVAAGAAEEPSAPDRADLLAAELDAAKNQAQESREGLLRALAEMENVRKRAQRDIEAAHRYAIERFALDMIEVRDTLELGIQAAGPAPDAEKLSEGMRATLRLIDKAFDRAGIVLVDPAGQQFNPEQHEAMTTQPSAEQPPGTVLMVIQKGFTLNGRLLRPARVITARAPDAAN